MNAAVVTSLHSSSSGFGKGGGRKKSNKTRVFCQWLQKRSRLGGKVWRATEKRFSGIFFFADNFFFGKPSAQVHLVSAGEIGRVLEEGREGRFVRSFGGGSVCISSLIYPSLSLFPPPPPKFLSYFHKEEEEERADGVVKGERSKAKAQGNERTNGSGTGGRRKEGSRKRRRDYGTKKEGFNMARSFDLFWQKRKLKR